MGVMSSEDRLIALRDKLAAVQDEMEREEAAAEAAAWEAKASMMRWRVAHKRYHAIRRKMEAEVMTLSKTTHADQLTDARVRRETLLRAASAVLEYSERAGDLLRSIADRDEVPL